MIHKLPWHRHHELGHPGCPLQARGPGTAVQGQPISMAHFSCPSETERETQSKHLLPTTRYPMNVPSRKNSSKANRGPLGLGFGILSAPRQMIGQLFLSSDARWVTSPAHLETESVQGFRAPVSS